MEKQPALTAKEKLLRERYVIEVYKDHKPIKALMRLGFKLDYARKYAIEFENDQYVLLLKDKIDRPDANDDNEVARLIRRSVEENDRNLVISTYRDIVQNKKSEDRDKIAAAKALSALRGFDKPEKVEASDDNIIAAFEKLGEGLKNDNY